MKKKKVTHCKPNTTSCKYCKTGDLTWQQDSTGWHLYDSNGILHDCKGYRRTYKTEFAASSRW